MLLLVFLLGLVLGAVLFSRTKTVVVSKPAVRRRRAALSTQTASPEEVARFIFSEMRFESVEVDGSTLFGARDGNVFYAIAGISEGEFYYAPTIALDGNYTPFLFDAAEQFFAEARSATEALRIEAANRAYGIDVKATKAEKPVVSVKPATSLNGSTKPSLPGTVGSNANGSTNYPNGAKASILHKSGRYVIPKWLVCKLEEGADFEWNGTNWVPLKIVKKAVPEDGLLI